MVVASKTVRCINVAPNTLIAMIKAKLVTAAAVTALIGCAAPPPRALPINVALLPQDCQNRQTMIDWLEGQARIPQHRSESDRDYQRTRNEIRSKIWDIRYHCQPV